MITEIRQNCCYCETNIKALTIFNNFVKINTHELQKQFIVRPYMFVSLLIVYGVKFFLEKDFFIKHINQQINFHLSILEKQTIAKLQFIIT
jgi:hypothetical protein